MDHQQVSHAVLRQRDVGDKRGKGFQLFLGVWLGLFGLSGIRFLGRWLSSLSSLLMGPIHGEVVLFTILGFCKQGCSGISSPRRNFALHGYQVSTFIQLDSTVTV